MFYFTCNHGLNRGKFAFFCMDTIKLETFQCLGPLSRVSVPVSLRRSATGRTAVYYDDTRRRHLFLLYKNTRECNSETFEVGLWSWPTVGSKIFKHHLIASLLRTVKENEFWKAVSVTHAVTTRSWWLTFQGIFVNALLAAVFAPDLAAHTYTSSAKRTRTLEKWLYESLGSSYDIVPLAACRQCANVWVSHIQGGSK